MFEVSFLQAMNHIVLNLFIPFFPWLLFLWMFFWNKFKWLFLYLMSWFWWFWIVSFSLFNMQFFHFWIWKLEYFFILFILILWFFLSLSLKKEIFWDYLKSLKMFFSLKFLKEKFLELTKMEKMFFWIWSVFLSLFVWISFAHNLTFPTYFDDSSTYRNTTSLNIFYDWWFIMFWDEDEILWKWSKLWYPIYLQIYKSLISDFIWYWNDIYANLFQYFTFLFWIIFTILISYKKTKNIFYSMVPSILICWLPLVYFHAIDWYMDIPSAVYSILVTYWILSFLEKNDFDYLFLSMFFWFILIYLKNDWFIIYLPWIVFWFLTILFLEKNFLNFVKNLFMNKASILKFIFLFMYFFVPFLAMKFYYWLWFNQAAWESSWVMVTAIHTEIFPVYKHIFFNADNYNISLLFLWFILFLYFSKKMNNNQQKFVLFSILFMLLMMNLVFLLTENYKRVLNQTTVNSSFTTIFMMLLSFYVYFIPKNNN